MRKTLFILLFGAAVFGISGRAQAPPDRSDFQTWNEIQFTVPLNKYFDLVTSVPTRIGKNITRFNEGRFVIGTTWKPHSSFNVQPFYSYIRARNTAGDFRTEHRLTLRGTYRFPIKSFGLSHRSTFEYRLRRPQNSWRYRPSITVEKDLPEKWIPGAKVFVTEEPFYDSLLERWSRNRFTIGITKTVGKQVSVDIYYLRQNDGFSRPGDLNVIGSTWKVKL